MRLTWLGACASLLMLVGCSGNMDTTDMRNRRDMGGGDRPDMTQPCTMDSQCGVGRVCDLTTHTCVSNGTDGGVDGGPDGPGPDTPGLDGPGPDGPGPDRPGPPMCGSGMTDYIAFVNYLITMQTKDTIPPFDLTGCTFTNLGLDNPNAFSPLPTPGP